LKLSGKIDGSTLYQLNIKTVRLTTLPAQPAYFSTTIFPRGNSKDASYNECSWYGNEFMAKLKLDLHDIYNRGDKIEAELNRIIQEAMDRRIKLVEIIPGKGSGQLKKRVLRFLNQPDIKKLYHRIEKDSKNFGRIFVHFRH
jgi:hypothetical protein